MRLTLDGDLYRDAMAALELFAKKSHDEDILSCINYIVDGRALTMTASDGYALIMVTMKCTAADPVPDRKIFNLLPQKIDRSVYNVDIDTDTGVVFCTGRKNYTVTAAPALTRAYPDLVAACLKMFEDIAGRATIRHGGKEDDTIEHRFNPDYLIKAGTAAKKLGFKNWTKMLMGPGRTRPMYLENTDESYKMRLWILPVLGRDL